MAGDIAHILIQLTTYCSTINFQNASFSELTSRDMWRKTFNSVYWVVLSSGLLCWVVLASVVIFWVVLASAVIFWVESSSGLVFGVVSSSSLVVRVVLSS